MQSNVYPAQPPMYDYQQEQYRYDGTLFYPNYQQPSSTNQPNQSLIPSTTFNHNIATNQLRVGTSREETFVDRLYLRLLGGGSL